MNSLRTVANLFVTQSSAPRRELRLRAVIFSGSVDKSHFQHRQRRLQSIEGHGEALG